jgi:hypothetical protein
MEQANINKFKQMLRDAVLLDYIVGEQGQANKHYFQADKGIVLVIVEYSSNFSNGPTVQTIAVLDSKKVVSFRCELSEKTSDEILVIAGICKKVKKVSYTLEYNS